MRRAPVVRGAVLAVLAILLVHPAGAVERCLAARGTRTGAVEVSARSVQGDARWGSTAGGESAAFANGASCAKRGRLKRCLLGAPETLAALTPPARCTVCVADAGTQSCCAFVRGCTPGVRVRDASFPPNDPRLVGDPVAPVPCPGSGDQTDSDGDGIGDACEPYGTWRFSSGTSPTFRSSVADRGARLEYLDLRADGTGEVRVFRPGSGALSCGTFSWAKSGRAALVPDLDSVGGAPRVLLYDRPAADQLHLRDASGGDAVYARVSGLPADLACRTPTLTTRLDGLPQPAGFSGLAFDGTVLWFNGEDRKLYPVNPATGALGTPLDTQIFTQPIFVYATQGLDFWGPEHSGPNISVDRVDHGGNPTDPGGIDTIVLGAATAINGVAYDPTGGVLFIQGPAAYGGGIRGPGQLVRVAPAGEPDLLLGVTPLDVRLNGITWDGSALWGLVRFPSAVVRIDVATSRVTDTFLLPIETAIEWVGIAAVGAGDLRLLGIDFDHSAGVIQGVRP